MWVALTQDWVNAESELLARNSNGAGYADGAKASWHLAII
jgi:hypothetical protein